MSYQIEMLWTCSTCHHRGNRGLTDRYCGNCGHKKDNLDCEYMPDDTSEGVALSGEAERKATAGRDWICRYCESVQNQLNVCCGNCGARDRGTELQSDAPVTAEDTELDEELERIRPATLRMIALKAALPAAVLAIVFALLVYFFTPRTVTTTVSQVYWQNDTLIDRYQIYQRDGWVPSVGAFDVRPLGLRHHHYDRVHVGSHSESYQDRYACGENCTTSPRYKTCSPNGNGTATCSWHGGSRSCTTKYCYRTAHRTVQDYKNVSREQTWYAWKAWEWGYHRTVRKSGYDHTMAWPTETELWAALDVGEKERGERRSSYKVTFRDAEEDESFAITPVSAAEFQRYDVGERFDLKVNRAGSIEVLP